MRHVIPTNMMVATALGFRATVWADHSMSEKHYWDIVSIYSQGCKQTILRLKLYCLTLAVWRQDTQILCAVSCQPMVGYINHGKPCEELMMCSPQNSIIGGFSKFTMSVHNGLNGKPKGFTTNFTGLRRIKKNLGSAFVPTKRANIACFALNKVDGGFIVPYYKGRNPGKPDKDKPNESVSDYSPHFSEEPRNFLKIKKTWKSLEKRYKGVKVPRKYVKFKIQ